VPTHRTPVLPECSRANSRPQSRCDWPSRMAARSAKSRPGCPHRQVDADLSQLRCSALRMPRPQSWVTFSPDTNRSPERAQYVSPGPVATSSTSRDAALGIGLSNDSSAKQQTPPAETHHRQPCFRQPWFRQTDSRRFGLDVTQRALLAPAPITARQWRLPPCTTSTSSPHQDRMSRRRRFCRTLAYRRGYCITVAKRHNIRLAGSGAAYPANDPLPAVWPKWAFHTS